MTEKNDITTQPADSLLRDFKSLIEQGRRQAVAAVNSALTVTYWQVGRRINEEVLHGQRAEYGKQVVVSLAKELSVTYGKSFEARNLRRMMQFAEVFPDFEIVSPLVSQLSWTHLPPKKLLEEKLHNALIEVRERLAARKLLEEDDD